MNFQKFFKFAMDREIPDLIAPFGCQLNIGCGNKKLSDCVNLDYPEYDAENMDLPFDDECFSFIHCYHYLEHLKDPVKELLKLQRVLKINGVINILVSYYKSNIASQDLDHKNYFTENTWEIIFTNKYYNKNKIEWKFKIGFNVIAGIVERNIALFTQLIKIN